MTMGFFVYKISIKILNNFNKVGAYNVHKKILSGVRSWHIKEPRPTTLRIRPGPGGLHDAQDVIH